VKINFKNNILLFDSINSSNFWSNNPSWVKIVAAYLKFGVADGEERHHSHQRRRRSVHLEVEDVLHHVLELVLVVSAIKGKEWMGVFLYSTFISLIYL
jgi:hypothetical protein